MKDPIIKKLENHDKRFDSMDNRLDLLATTVVDIQEKLKEHDNKFDRITITVVDIQEQVNDIKETMATKSDISNMSNTLDELVGLAKKKDQELTFMGVRVKRVEDDVRQIKPLVGLKIN